VRVRRAFRARRASLRSTARRRRSEPHPHPNRNRLAALLSFPPPHEPRALLVTTAPLPLRQDAAAPRTDGSRGRTERATPPAPCDPISPPSKPQNEIVVSPSSLLTTSPVDPGDELAGFWSSPPAMAPEDYIASISVFPGRFLQVSRDPVVKVKVRDSAVPSKNH
jgi:hypothetical protein